jgi:hypothetical protein
MSKKPLRCSWPAMAHRRKLARTSGRGYWVSLSFGLRPGTSGSKIVRPRAGSPSFIPAKGARGKQNRLGVEAWDLPAKTKPPARRISLCRDQTLRHGDLGCGGRKTGKDIFQRPRALRTGARPLLNQFDGGASCLSAKCPLDKGSGGRFGIGRLRKRPGTVAGTYTYVKVLLPTYKTYFRCH